MAAGVKKNVTPTKTSVEHASGDLHLLGEANAESARLRECHESHVPWNKWGPYLSERQWGTVREDYSEDGNAWDYFSHDQARSPAYRWARTA